MTHSPTSERRASRGSSRSSSSASKSRPREGDTSPRALQGLQVALIVYPEVDAEGREPGDELDRIGFDIHPTSPLSTAMLIAFNLLT